MTFDVLLICAWSFQCLIIGVLFCCVWQYLPHYIEMARQRMAVYHKKQGYLVSEKTLHKHFAHIMFDPCKVCHCLKCSICKDQNFMQVVLVCVFFLFFQKQWVLYLVFGDIRPYAAVMQIVQLLICIDKT